MERTLKEVVAKGRLRSMPRAPNTDKKDRKESAPRQRKPSTGENKLKREKSSGSLRKYVPSVKSHLASEDGSHSSLNQKFGNAKKKSVSKSKTMQSVAQRDDSAHRYLNGAFSRLQAIKPKDTVQESPLLRTDGARMLKPSKTIVQNGSNIARIINKPPIAVRTDRKVFTQNPGVLKLVEASPYGIGDVKPPLSKPAFKEGRPPVVPTADRSNTEISELYEKHEFYEFKKFFSIEASNDPFANVEEKEDNFTIDVRPHNLVTRTQHQ
jgi:hypothetical protein